MEKGPNTSIGFSVSDKKSSSNCDFVSSMMGTRHLDRLSGGTGGGGDDVEDGGGSTGGGVVGPTNSSGGANEVAGNIYRDDAISASSRGGENLVPKGTNLQPFDIFPSSSNHTIPNKSPAGTMAATLEFPFTSAQWKELERQAMIYKYMIYSVPVPSHLLFPLSRDFPAPTVETSASLCSGRYSKKGDPEPGRCKRTDGKKWRCSRDVAPLQKYCERHLHRGRPRSRKPVEVKSNAENHKKQTTRSLPSLQSAAASASASASSQQHFIASQNEPFLLFNDKTDLSICTPSYKEANRDLSLMMENEIVPRDPWQHWMEPNIGLANEGFSVYTSDGPIFHQDYVEYQQLNSFPYPNLAAPEIELPNGFIDAWSIDNMNRANNVNVESSISLNDGDLSPSLNLSMAMAAGDILDKEMLTIEMGNSSVSWEPFARGGPLGEALQPIGDSNPPSPYNSISTPATTVSSPSGVLHRTLFSHSDGSVCNSPIRF